MDGFGDSFVPSAEDGAPPAGEVDPAAEFLAREQDQLAGLDDDLVPAAPADGVPLAASTGYDGEADFFGGGAPPVNGGPDLESFEMLGGDEIARDNAPPPPTTASLQPSGDQSWGADSSSSPLPNQPELFTQPPAAGLGAEEDDLGFTEPLSSSPSAGVGEGFPPAADLTDGMASDAGPVESEMAPERDYSGFGNAFDSSVPAGDPSAAYYSGLGEDDQHDSSSYPDPARSPVPSIPREEPEKIKIWREEQRIRLEQKDIAEEENKDELREKAKKELEDWYKQHEEQVAKTRQANRSAEKELVADTGKMEPGTEWERIAKLCDFNPKTAKSTRDISRMRSIILQVKQNPPIKA